MAHAKVSQDFNRFLGRHEKAVKEARKAENTMQTCAMPVGWTGNCVLVEAVADKGKDKKAQDGTVVEGKPYVRFTFQVVGDKQFAGKKFSRWWFFNDTANATAADRFEWFLNDLENIGLPSEIRRSDDTTMQDMLDFFLQRDAVYGCEVVASEYSRDGKEVKVFPTESVGDGDSIVPDDESSESGEIEVGSKVTYMGKEWEVLDVDGDDLKIKSVKTGMTRTVNVSDLD
ncbi:MAG: hypothetical protein KatS3mg087_1397 [Patescibacteria group bacterium]|nr:MAG: hypothetical protein KatS3mg087_1397 [Patescibacteria group bacterium]